MRNDCAAHPLNCTCRDCVFANAALQQTLTEDPPMSTLPQTSVSVHELLDRHPRLVNYQVLEDWNDD